MPRRCLGDPWFVGETWEGGGRVSRLGEWIEPTKKFLNFRTVTTSFIFSSHSVKMEGSVLWFNLFLQQNYNSLSLSISISILGKGCLQGYGNV